jgi:hypothetical protein
MNNTIQFHSGTPATEVLRLSKDGIWANPDIPADDAAKLVLEAIDDNIKILVQKAVQTEREACAKVVEEIEARCVAEDVDDLPLEHVAAAIRARGQAEQALDKKAENARELGLDYEPAPVQEPLMAPEGKCKECLTYNGHQDGCSHATPPAAQPAVPDAFGTREGEHPEYIQGWNDCRQAMLRHN